jgi:hypothetical protein
VDVLMTRRARIPYILPLRHYLPSVCFSQWPACSEGSSLDFLMVRRHTSPTPVPSRHYLLTVCFSQWLACFIACVIHKVVVEEFCRSCFVRLWACATDACYELSGTVDYPELNLSPPGFLCPQYTLVCRLNRI